MIVAFDPSINQTGWAVLNEAEGLFFSDVIRPKGKEYGQRLLSLSNQVSKAVKKVFALCHSNEVLTIAVEIPGKIIYSKRANFGKPINLEAMQILNWATGVIISVSAQFCDKPLLVEAKEYKYGIDKEKAKLITGVKNHNEADAILLMQYTIRQRRLNNGQETICKS